MKSKHSQLRPEQKGPVLEIASLIDVCFLLLIYFIATTTIIPAERDLGMKLPAIGEGVSFVKMEPLLIRIESNGAVLAGALENLLVMDSDPSLRDLPLLSNHLEMMRYAAMAAGNELVVQIDADDECQQQRVIDVLDALVAARIDAVMIRDLVPGV